ncbi:MAG: hypothetical protein PHT07_20705 [Paludibacter sp.]|nr:hypothetical protein [Paludibacter sp.]
MNQIEMSSIDVTKKIVAIVLFGRPTQVSGFRAGEYFQVTIDPAMVSPSGEYIRFGKNQGDEIMGWQRVDALTILEVLGEWDGDEPPDMTIGANGVTMIAVE